MMTIIGLDGGTWPYIATHLEELPTFGYLAEHYEAGTLECDVRGIGTLPSWPTILTGLAPQEHDLYNFLEGDEIEQALEQFPWIWKRFDRPYVLAVPISRPPICVNTEMPGWRDLLWPGRSPTLMNQSTSWLASASRQILERRPELYVVIFPALDRAGHHFIANEEVWLEAHRRLDEALGELLPLFEDGPFLFVSDHGMTDCREALDRGWRKPDERLNPLGGCHSPYGMIVGNRGICDKVTEVYDLVTDRYVEGDR